MPTKQTLRRRLRDRNTAEVFEDHLRKRQKGELEAGLARNDAPDVILLTSHGVFKGREGVRRSAALLREELPCGTYDYRTKMVDGEVAFLEWAARCPTARVDDGADSFLIRDGRIVAQTVHYTVKPLGKNGPKRGRLGGAP